jgi:predicted regulator of Ras-like GTPase activity (Roadblock/LC7/MglB family)
MTSKNEFQEPLPKNNKTQKRNETLHVKLQNIKTKQGIIGYIIRDPKSASVDIKDPTKIINYALLASTLHDSGESMISAFELGKVNNIVLEGKDVKVLTLTIDDNRISIFMNKNVNHNTIYKDLRS